MNKTIFVTGSAGFIGSNLVLKLLKENNDIHIIGIDNMNDYYDVSIKEYRLNKIKKIHLITKHQISHNKRSFIYQKLIRRKIKMRKTKIKINSKKTQNV